MLQIRLPLPRFVSAGEILSGPGTLGALRVLDAARASVLASPSVLAKHRDTFRRCIGAEAVTLIEMPQGEPTWSALASVVAQVEAFQPDWMIAVGGGSTLDGAKIAWVLYEHPALERERLMRLGGIPALRGKARFVAVPTTAGTGSEASSSALVVDSTSGAKHALVSHDLLPDIAVLDPRLAMGCPPAVIAHAGLDALAHAVECYGSRLNNTLADALAEKAAEEIFVHLPAYWGDPGNEAFCLKMMNAALLAGWVQNQKIPGIGHAIAHQLGGLGVAHGRATGCLLAAAVDYNCGDVATAARYDQLGKALGFGDHLGLIDNLRRLVGAVECAALPERVAESLDSIAAGAAEDPCARTNPRLVDRDAVAQVIEASR